MAINLLEKTTEILGYTPLIKIDPNTERIKTGTAIEQELAQAVIPAVLAGISEMSKSEEGIGHIVRGTHTDWGQLMFGTKKEEITGNIAGYALYDFKSTDNKINETANVAVQLIRENNTDDSGNYKMIKDFIKNQRDNILPFLPPQLHLGNLMANSTIDDKTNKMQGPVSSLMHKIEATFGGNETQEDADKKSNTV